MPIIERLAGTTITVTWVNSGMAPSPIVSNLRDRNETLVSSTAAISSGDGHFFALHYLPSSWAANSSDSGHSPQGYWMINEWFATINANTYRDRQFVHAILPRVS